MKSVVNGGSWQTRGVTTGKVAETFQARDVMREISTAAHICGDPGLQYDTTINRWNPVKNSGRINATNPCSEFIFLDDTACNLASFNLLKFADESGTFRTEDFAQAVDTMILAMEIIVEDLIKMLDNLGNGYRRGRHSASKTAGKTAAVLRAVADELEL